MRPQMPRAGRERVDPQPAARARPFPRPSGRRDSQGSKPRLRNERGGAGRRQSGKRSGIVRLEMKTLRARIGARRPKRGAGLPPGWVRVRSWAGERAWRDISKAVSNPNLAPSQAAGFAILFPPGAAGTARPQLFPRARGPSHARGSVGRRACIPSESRPAARAVTASPVQPFPHGKATANLWKMLSDGAQGAVKSVRLFSGIHVRRKRGSAEKEK